MMTADPTDPFAHASEAAKTVWQDLLTVDPPLTVEERLDAVLAAYRETLAAAGYLQLPDLAPTADELDQIAQWLARESGFARYWDDHPDNPGTPGHDGWKELRTEPRHVEIAYNKAKARHADDPAQVTALVAARRLLLSACEHAAGNRP